MSSQEPELRGEEAAEELDLKVAEAVVEEEELQLEAAEEVVGEV
jgi:hypothetical protein